MCIRDRFKADNRSIDELKEKVTAYTDNIARNPSLTDLMAVSYTHLDVYKRQIFMVEPLKKKSLKNKVQLV